MTINSYPSNQAGREPRMPVRLPDRSPANLFPGWGPKL
jgi:hypothetical protein